MALSGATGDGVSSANLADESAYDKEELRKPHVLTNGGGTAEASLNGRNAMYEWK